MENNSAGLLTSTHNVFPQDVSTATLLSAHSTADYSVDKNSNVQNSLTASHSDYLTVQYSTLYHHSSSTTLLPTATHTPPLTSFVKPYETSNLKTSSQSSVEFTSHVSPSSAILSSSAIPPILPTAIPTTTNGSVSSTATPSSLTENLTLILGMSLCGVGVVVFIVIVLLVCCRKRSKSKQQTVETVQIGDLWASNRGDISYAPTFDAVLDTVSESPKVRDKSSKDVLYNVLYPYTAQDESQLNLDLGDVVTLIEKRGNGWWKGRIKDKEGWFPGSYVEEADISTGYTSNHQLHNGHSPLGVSSFLKNQDLTPKLTKSTSNRNSAPVYTCDKKILGKEVAIPKVPMTTTPSDSPVKSNLSPVHSKVEKIDGVRFYVLNKHEPNFSNELKIDPGDIIIGIEKDMNGWMKGKKEKSGEIGMFPAIYVHEIIQNEQPAGFTDKQSVYDQLPVCFNDMSTAEYIGVEHVAVCPYAAENETDLSFDMGDTIIVCQTLDNGWWYGCYGDQFGWFPGSYVEMVEDEVDGSYPGDSTQDGEVTQDNIPDSTVVCDKPLEVSLDKDIAALSPIKPHGGNKSDDEISQKSVEKKQGVAKDSPKRSKLPTAMRPSRPAPPPPIQHHSTPESKSNLMDKFNKVKEINNVSKSNSEKPQVPKRFIKPKLRKVPKKKTKAGNESELCRRKVRSPPPPRPDPPKFLPMKNSFNQSEISQKEVKDSNISDLEIKLNNISGVIENSVCGNQDDSGNMTSFLENSQNTDTSFGKISGLTSLSSSVQGERTHDQSELTNISAINMSDMNDSKQVSNRNHSLTAESSGQVDDLNADVVGQVEDDYKTNNVVEQDNNVMNGEEVGDKIDQVKHKSDGEEVGDSIDHVKHKSDSRLPCKLPQPKAHSVRSTSPKQNVLPKSQSLRSNLPKPPPVAPKPSKASFVRQMSPYREPLYSEVGTSLVGSDIIGTSLVVSDVGTSVLDSDVVDGPIKIEPLQRPQSPIYSKIDKKYVVPNQTEPVNNSNDLSNTDASMAKVAKDQKPLESEICDNGPSDGNNFKLKNSINCENQIDFGVGHDSYNENVQRNDNTKSEPDEVTEHISDSAVHERRDSGSKPSSIPVQRSSHSSNIPIRPTSPPTKQGNMASSIPKPNFSPTLKDKPESLEESVSDQESKYKPERPSRPPNVVRHSSLTSASPSRLPKVEKSKSLRAESPKMGTKAQRPKLSKDGSKIPSGIPKSPKQKAQMASPQMGSNHSRLPRKAVNGIVSPKPKRPPPPKSPPMSPVIDSQPSTYANGRGHDLTGDEQMNFRPNIGNLLKKTVASYTAKSAGELSFQEGCFIRQIGQDQDTGMCIGMLPNGETGLYHVSYVEDTHNEEQSVV